MFFFPFFTKYLISVITGVDGVRDAVRQSRCPCRGENIILKRNLDRIKESRKKDEKRYRKKG